MVSKYIWVFPFEWMHDWWKSAAAAVVVLVNLKGKCVWHMDLAYVFVYL